MDFLLIWRCSYQRGQWIFVTSKLTQNLKLHVCIPWWIFLHVNKKRNFQENYRTFSFRKVQKITRMRKLCVEHKEILIFFFSLFWWFILQVHWNYKWLHFSTYLLSEVHVISRCQRYMVRKAMYKRAATSQSNKVYWLHVLPILEW